MHVIEQLLVQICAVEVHAKKGAPSQSKVLSRIAEKVHRWCSFVPFVFRA